MSRRGASFARFLCPLGLATVCASCGAGASHSANQPAPPSTAPSVAVRQQAKRQPPSHTETSVAVAEAAPAASRCVGLPKAADLPDALRTHRRLCFDGKRSECTPLGASLKLGSHGIKDGERALKYLHCGCAGGSADACNLLGTMYEQADGVEKDLAQAAELYQNACERKSADACTNLAAMYQQGVGVETNPKQAVALLQRACSRKHADACAELGRMHHAGSGVEKNLEQALTLYQHACQQKEPSKTACLSLGHAFETGQGRPLNIARAKEYYQRSCSDSTQNLGELTGEHTTDANPLGCVQLVKLLHPVPSDTPSSHPGAGETAAALLKTGCLSQQDYGRHLACKELATRAYDTGSVTEMQQTSRWLEEQCERHHKDACFALGTLQSQRGRLRAALRSNVLACNLGSQHGCEATKPLLELLRTR